MRRHSNRELHFVLGLTLSSMQGKVIFCVWATCFNAWVLNHKMTWFNGELNQYKLLHLNLSLLLPADPLFTQTGRTAVATLQSHDIKAFSFKRLRSNEKKQGISSQVKLNAQLPSPSYKKHCAKRRKKSYPSFVGNGITVKIRRTQLLTPSSAVWFTFWNHWSSRIKINIKTVSSLSLEFSVFFSSYLHRRYGSGFL